MALREQTEKSREAQGLTVRAARMAGDYWREHWRGYLISAAAGVFLALVGAFGTDAAAMPVRIAYWTSLLIIGAAIGSAAGALIAIQPSVQTRRWRVWLLTSLIVSVPMTFVVWGATGPLFLHRLRIDDIPYFLGTVLTVSLPLTAIMVWHYMPGPATHATASGAEPRRVAFLDRLPPKLMGAAIWAVEAEDHYLRVHTSKGSDLILLRLADAIRELEGVEGAQVHRSWWVAKDGVLETTRDGARVSLKLRDGALAPVSRPNVKALREAGWF